ncbi:MAG: thermonuclease family protein [Methanobrevibacter sp.]|jgi:micrococcal nuclease|nr:thermonuclease family protein [Candidatus Methanovirga aequatorialis]
MKKKVIILLIILFSIGTGVIYNGLGQYTNSRLNHSMIQVIDSNAINQTDAINQTNYNQSLKFNNDFTGRCTHVIDGDTVDIEGIGRIRLVGVDTPEKGEKGYEKAKNFTKNNLLNKTVVLDIDSLAWKGKYGVGKDRYNRTLAKILINDMKTDFNQLLVDEGYARVYYFSPSEFPKIEKK